MTSNSDIEQAIRDNWSFSKIRRELHVGNARIMAARDVVMSNDSGNDSGNGSGNDSGNDISATRQAVRELGARLTDQAREIDRLVGVLCRIETADRTISEKVVKLVRDQKDTIDTALEAGLDQVKKRCDKRINAMQKEMDKLHELLAGKRTA